MNAYTCELCGKLTKDYIAVTTPFYFAVLPGGDNDAWGKHSNVAKACERHLDEYDWPVWVQSQSDLRPRREQHSPMEQLRAIVIGRAEQRRIPDDVKPDYYFAR